MAISFGQRVRALRQARGLRVRDVAAAAAITSARLAQIEHDRSVPDEALICRLAESVDAASTDELLLLAGYLPADLRAILQRHPAESAQLLRDHFDRRTPPVPAGDGRLTFVPVEVVRPIVQWAIRSARDTVLDPACGDGMWLAAAAARLRELDENPAAVAEQLHGYDADQEACARAKHRLGDVIKDAACSIHAEDFLHVASRARLPFEQSGPSAVSVVLGTIDRTQVRSASARQHAHRVAAEAGIALPQTAPEWAALIVHAASFVQRDGRLALLVPAALLTAHYAADVRSYLAQLFPRLTVITFERPLPGVGEVAIVLGTTTGEPEVRTLRVDSVASVADALNEGDASTPGVAETRPLRWSSASLPTRGRLLLRSLQRAGLLRRLGDLVEIDAGVVTGANGFFVLSAPSAGRVGTEFVQPMLASSSDVPGLLVGRDDWQAIADRGRRCYLLVIPPGATLDRSTRAYIDEGKRQGLDERATCRRRPTWYALPKPDRPAALLPYLCPRRPRMLLNEAGVTHTNALHSVRPRAGVNIAAVATSFLSTAALLGCELLGRHFGNGVLKLEPTEMENLLVPYPTHGDAIFDGTVLRGADALWRDGRDADAIAEVDRVLLRDVLGLDAAALSELRGCYDAERRRRARR